MAGTPTRSCPASCRAVHSLQIMRGRFRRLYDGRGLEPQIGRTNICLTVP